MTEAKHINFTVDQLRDLAECERMMDSGEVPHVVAPGGRMMVQQIIMDELGLENGQTVSADIATAIMRSARGLIQAAKVLS